jgi:hypothetical protein
MIKFIHLIQSTPWNEQHSETKKQWSTGENHMHWLVQTSPLPKGHASTQPEQSNLQHCSRTKTPSPSSIPPHSHPHDPSRAQESPFPHPEITVPQSAQSATSSPTAKAPSSAIPNSYQSIVPLWSPMSFNTNNWKISSAYSRGAGRQAAEPR